MDPNLCREQPFAKTIVISESITSSTIPTIRMSMSTRKIFGYIGNVLLSGDFLADSLSAPTAEWQYIMSVANLDANPTPESVLYLSVIQSYDVVFTERNIMRDGIPT